MWRLFSVFRDPYKDYAFRLKFDGRYVGGFSEVAGLAGALEAPHETLRPTPSEAIEAGEHHSTLTLKRGLIDGTTLYEWIKNARDSANLWRQDISLEVRDEAGQTIATFLVRRSWPAKYTGPTLSAKGNRAVALEELVLGYESYEARV